MIEIIAYTKVAHEGINCTDLSLDNLLFIIEPADDKTYDKICATSEDSDQPAHPCRLIRVFADRMCLVQPPGYPKRDEREPLPYLVDVQADLSLCWSHRSYC